MSTCAVAVTEAEDPPPTFQLNSYSLSRDDNWAAQLASQHHLSEYNRLKFGPHGASMAYVPLSIHTPHYFRGLQERQRFCSKIQAWWPSPKPTCQPCIILGPCGAQAESDTNLQRELSAAISSPLKLAAEPPSYMRLVPAYPHLPMKTSASHPINISTIIPPEFLPIISSNIQLAPESSPTICQVPHTFALDQLMRQAPQRTWVPSPIISTPPPQFMNGSPSIPAAISTVDNAHNDISLSTALLAAINTDSKLSPSALLDTSSRIATEPATSPPFTPLSASLVSLTSQIDASTPSLVIPDVLPHPELSEGLSNGHFLPTDAAQSTGDLSTTTSSSSFVSVPSPFSLGNLLLSSCPGKKIRLTGPVKGRSGVCRDLATDLARMRDLHVGCIVCCLDDVELEFLGAPWPEYVVAAREVGIDVLRLPTPEGLAPLGPGSLDDHLTHLIRDYTLKGINILVHCRGGVGRAGVVASCWIFRLGLCGSIPALPPPSPNNNNNKVHPTPTISEYNQNAPTTLVEPQSPETMRLVERVIDVVRKRRSIKAIETFEQVSFLTEFVNYLRAAPGSSSDASPLAA